MNNIEDEEELLTQQTNSNDKMDYRNIGKIMTKAGFSMNHATARNQVVLGIKDILSFIVNDLRSDISLEQISDLINDPAIQENLQEVLYAAFKELEKEDLIAFE